MGNLDWQSVGSAWEAHSFGNVYRLEPYGREWRLEAEVSGDRYVFSGTERRLRDMAEELELQSVI